eukprot:14604796-Alexandrium_andersonii.AAC.1
MKRSRKSEGCSVSTTGASTGAGQACTSSGWPWRSDKARPKAATVGEPLRSVGFRTSACKIRCGLSLATRSMDGHIALRY